MGSPYANDKVIEASGEDANRALNECSNKTNEDSPSECSKEKEAPGKLSKIVDGAKADKVRGSKQQLKTVHNIPFWVHIYRRAHHQGRPVRACRLTGTQGERTRSEGVVGSSRKRIKPYDRSNKEDMEIAGSSSEEEVVVRRPSIKK